MNIFSFFDIVKLPLEVKKALGFAEPIVSSMLNLLAIGIIFFLAFRLFQIALQGLSEFRKGDDQASGSGVLKSTIVSMAATFAAGAVAWVLLNNGMPWLLSYATGALSAVSSDPILAGETAVDRFFAKAPLFKTIFTTVRDIASIGVIFIGGLILAKTGLDAIRKTNYSAGEGSNAFDGVKNAIVRSVMIIILGFVAYVAINLGPELLFGYLDQLQSTLSNAPTTTQ